MKPLNIIGVLILFYTISTSIIGIIEKEYATSIIHIGLTFIILLGLYFINNRFK